ncbi:hypothetical protein D3C83_84860 [compost metagenome]
MRMSIGHSSSAYSLEEVMPIGSVIAADTITTCQPQNVNAASRSQKSRACAVRCTT